MPGHSTISPPSAKHDVRVRRTERVDDAFLLFRNALHAAYPLTAVAERADALNVVRALEGRDKEVPCMETPRQHWNNERLSGDLTNGVAS